MTKDEAIKLALEALERCVANCFDRYSHEEVMSRPEHFVNQTITALREALAEQPAQRTWVGLTPDEIIRCTPTWGGTVEDVAIAIEAKLKEKNT